MATYINYDESTLEENNVNFVPCTVSFNGKAKINTYFKDKCRSDDDVKTASFRGRPLLGCEITVPEGYCGYIIKKSNQIHSNQDKIVNIHQFFRKMKLWNLDREPSKDDSILSALDWLDISEAVHLK